MMISVWTNPIAIFILNGARTTEQSQVKHEFCARVLYGEFIFKNLGYWNAYCSYYRVCIIHVMLHMMCVEVTCTGELHT